MLTQEGRPAFEKGKSHETPILIEELEELVEQIANTWVKISLNFAEDKSPPLKKHPADQIFEKFETLVRRMESSADMKEKFYLWATHVKTYRDEGTNDWEPICILNAQQLMQLSKIYFASLKVSTYIEAENMAIGNHDGGEFLQPKTKKPFNIEDYKMFIPFLDLKKLASHPYIFVPICYAEHWWLWVADVRKKKFCILNPYHKTCPSKPRMKLNKFVVICDPLGVFRGYVISRMRVYAGETPLKKDDHEIEPPYINIAGQKTQYKSYRHTSTLSEVDHFRVDYASRILFHEMNQDRDIAIKESEAIRLSKPSTVLLSPYCQIDSDDIDSD
ncbi:hypothetical protein Ahy_B10g100694 [Arachis hypogaea]|uniref:Ubiquitin-like protease family profile domain-containing protein n=1 Tax=Arachis hypogaea TaxID=3818 RepID=A0A444WXB0_ARAHY|nr:hypothetical protein Ahy_B10g100694 [Arachis hypogaea]